MKEIWIVMFMFFVVGMLSGCEMYAGTHYYGRTDKSYTTESPKFRAHKVINRND